MDEPTSGLDPNQLTEIRGLIKEIGKQKTVILSTHIMQEVEAVCDRIIIINKGGIVADERTSQIQNRIAGDNIIEVEFDKETEKEKLTYIDGVLKVTHLEGNKWRILAKTGQDIRGAVFNYAVQHGMMVLALQKQEQSLEEVFHVLTKN